VNGFGAYMSSIIARLNTETRVSVHGVVDDFIEQAPRSKQLAVLGLDAKGIANRVSSAFGLESARGTHLRAI
jgi:deoxyxylulose-5-phosphate synthase